MRGGSCPARDGRDDEARLWQLFHHDMYGRKRRPFFSPFSQADGPRRIDRMEQMKRVVSESVLIIRVHHIQPKVDRE